MQDLLISLQASHVRVTNGLPLCIDCLVAAAGADLGGCPDALALTPL